MSKDPRWCDVCGAELNPSPGGWLEEGDTIRVRLHNGPPALRLPSLVQPVEAFEGEEDTLPPQGAHHTTPLFLRETGPLDADEANASSAPLEETEIALTESLAVLNHKRVWRGKDDYGRLYRVEERATPSREALPEGAEQLSSVVDLPLAAVERGEHQLRVYRFVPGRTMHERRIDNPNVLTPTEIVEWIRPVVRALKTIHEAGFLCLRVCPYTVKFTVGGDVFFQNVDVLYRRDAALTTLPAIAGYTAPEVFEASLESPPDVRADLYAVAMLVYYLIAGGDPPTSVHTGYAPALRARDFAPNFALGFASALETLGSPDPEARPASAEDLLELLSAARDRSVRQRAPDVPLRVSVAADTHVGIVKRYHTAENQDAVFARSDPDTNTSLIVVADGVSTATYGAGDIASRLCVQAFNDAWIEFLAQPLEALGGDAGAWLTGVIDRANRAIVDAVNEEHAPFEGEPSEVMGSTCVAALIQGGHVTLASIGDSRAYLLRDGFAERITRDHNVLTLGVVGGLDADVALTLPQAEALARCLGAFDLDDCTTLKAIDLEPDVFRFDLTPGDRLLLCSDGLTDYAANTEAESERIIHQIVASEDLPELACIELIRAANRGGGGDNIGLAIAVAEPAWTDVFEWFGAQRGYDEDAADDI